MSSNFFTSFDTNVSLSGLTRKWFTEASEGRDSTLYPIPQSSNTGNNINVVSMSAEVYRIYPSANLYASINKTGKLFSVYNGNTERIITPMSEEILGVVVTIVDFDNNIISKEYYSKLLINSWEPWQLNWTVDSSIGCKILFDWYVYPLVDVWKVYDIIDIYDNYETLISSSTSLSINPKKDNALCCMRDTYSSMSSGLVTFKSLYGPTVVTTLQKCALHNLVILNQPAYKSYADSVIGFVFNGFDGLLKINNISIDFIKALARVRPTAKNIGNRIKYETLKGYCVDYQWELPKDGTPSINGNAADYIGYYIDGGKDYFVVYGLVDGNGYIRNIPGSLSDIVSLEYNKSSSSNNEVIVTDPTTGLPVSRKITFQVLSGARLDALCSRSDCGNTIQKYYDFSKTLPGTVPGEIKIC